MHRRSLEIWTDLEARGVLSPVDTPRVSAAHRAVLRTEGAMRDSRMTSPFEPDAVERLGDQRSMGSPSGGLTIEPAT